MFTHILRTSITEVNTLIFLTGFSIATGTLVLVFHNLTSLFLLETSTGFEPV